MNPEQYETPDDDLVEAVVKTSHLFYPIGSPHAAVRTVAPGMQSLALLELSLDGDGAVILNLTTSGLGETEAEALEALRALVGYFDDEEVGDHE